MIIVTYRNILPLDQIPFSTFAIPAIPRVVAQLLKFLLRQHAHALLQSNARWIHLRIPQKNKKKSTKIQKVTLDYSLNCIESCLFFGWVITFGELAIMLSSVDRRGICANQAGLEWFWITNVHVQVLDCHNINGASSKRHKNTTSSHLYET